MRILPFFALVSSALSQSVEFSPGSEAPGVSFRLNIPTSTASSKSGPIYFQISAPSSLQWVALGQGSGMEGANVFLLYSASSSNVTLSPRLATGHSQPMVNPQAKITLLEGTGITDGKMVANVRCDSCLSWEGGKMDPTDASSSWIWGLKRGSSIESSSISENIRRHDDRGIFTFNLRQATAGNSDNPFKSGSPPPTNGSLSPPASTPSAPKKSSIDIKRAAHGIIMSIVFVILFPLFGLTVLLIPSKKTVPFIHAPLQLITLCLAIAGFGIGISLATSMKATNAYHPVIGYVVIGGLVLFQPALGLLQHLNYRKTGTSSAFGLTHRWIGRLIIILAVVNGGLGFRFAGIGNPGVPKSAVIAYGVIAGIIGLLYVGVVLMKGSKSRSGVNGEPVRLDSIRPKTSNDHSSREG